MKLSNTGSAKGPVIKIKCPHCGNNGTFESLGVNDVYTPGGVGGFFLGIRRCPNDLCHGHLFFITEGLKIISAFPTQRIDFDRTDIPENVIKSFVEAITCHAEGCYTASAIMIRKTLEEICLDRGATGDNLKKRIAKLGEKILIPKELIEGMDELRLLGNDAAHFESKAFNQVGEEEIEVGIIFTKEILKAVYQYENLLNKLKSLKKAP
jgi:hypothetical protein